MMGTADQRDRRYERTQQEHQHQWLISKLRWMGLEQEADRMTAQRVMATPTTLPAETD